MTAVTFDAIYPVVKAEGIEGKYLSDSESIVEYSHETYSF
jgi:hypothetical protein